MTAVAYVLAPSQLRSAEHAIAWNEGRITRQECDQLLRLERFVLLATPASPRNAELDRWLMERGSSLHGRATKAPA